MQKSANKKSATVSEDARRRQGATVAEESTVRQGATVAKRLDVRFEQMATGHLDEVLAIERTFSAPWTREMFSQELQKQWDSADSLVALAESGTVVGYVLFWFVADEVHIVNLAVHPRVRRRRLGTSLMHEVLKRALARGMAIATLEVRVHNTAAIRLYEGLEFHSVAIRKNYYADNGEDAMVMVRHLDDA